MEFIHSTVSTISDTNSDEVAIDINDTIAISVNDTDNDEKTSSINNNELEEFHVYQIYADSKKSTYQTEYWVNRLSSGKRVTLLLTTTFRWGTFEIELTDTEKEEILKKETIVLNEYNCSGQELWDGCDQFHEIRYQEKYSDSELKEIKKMIYWHDNEEEREEQEEEDDEYLYDSDAEYCFDLDVLEANKWEIDDTIYGFDTGCELKLISD